MLKDAMDITREHYMLEPKHKNSLNVYAPIRDVNNVLLNHKKGQVGAHEFQKMDQPLRFQPLNHEFHQPYQLTELQQH